MLDELSQNLPLSAGLEERQTEQEQSFYIAIFLYESTSSAPGYRPLYQESFVLIKARSLEEAQAKARARAEEEQVSYTNEAGEIINWALKRVIDVNPTLDDVFEDGSDLYARHFRNYAAYAQFEPLLSGEALDD